MWEGDGYLIFFVKWYLRFFLRIYSFFLYFRICKLESSLVVYYFRKLKICFYLLNIIKI